MGSFAGLRRSLVLILGLSLVLFQMSSPVIAELSTAHDDSRQQQQSSHTSGSGGTVVTGQQSGTGVPSTVYYYFVPAGQGSPFMFQFLDKANGGAYSVDGSQQQQASTSGSSGTFVTGQQSGTGVPSTGYSYFVPGARGNPVLFQSLHQPNSHFVPVDNVPYNYAAQQQQQQQQQAGSGAGQQQQQQQQQAGSGSGSAQQQQQQQQQAAFGAAQQQQQQQQQQAASAAAQQQQQQQQQAAAGYGFGSAQQQQQQQQQAGFKWWNAVPVAVDGSLAVHDQLPTVSHEVGTSPEDQMVQFLTPEGEMVQGMAGGVQVIGGRPVTQVVTAVPVKVLAAAAHPPPSAPKAKAVGRKELGGSN